MAFEFSGSANEGVDLPVSAEVAVLDAYTILGWIFATDNSGGSDFAAIYGEISGGTAATTIQMKQSGIIRFFTRESSSPNVTLDTVSGQDNGGWHRIMVVKSSDSDHALYLDGSLAEEDTTTTIDRTTSSTIVEIGNSDGGNILPNGSRIARFRTFDRALTVAEGEMYLRTGMPSVDNVVWMEGFKGGGATEPDLSGNGRNGTVTGVTVGNHAPVQPLFEHAMRASATISVQTVSLGQAIETNTALGVALEKAVPAGQALEADAALTVDARKDIALGLGIDSTIALPLGLTKSLALNQAVEADQALTATISKAVALALAIERDQALALTISASQSINLGQALEADQALALALLKTVPLGLAVEGDRVLAVTLTVTPGAIDYFLSIEAITLTPLLAASLSTRSLLTVDAATLTPQGYSTSLQLDPLLAGDIDLQPKNN